MSAKLTAKNITPQVEHFTPIQCQIIKVTLEHGILCKYGHSWDVNTVSYLLQVKNF